MRTFHIELVGSAKEYHQEITADFIEVRRRGFVIRFLNFYVKPHWWSRARLVGVVECGPLLVLCSSRQARTDQEFLREAGIR